jgi:hypothetical protein
MKKLNFVKINHLIYLLFVILFFTTCKKEDKGDVIFFSNGSVSGTIKGTKTDNSVLDEQFSFSKYLDYLNDPCYQITPQGYNFYIEFINPDFSLFSLEFTLSSATDITPDVSKFSIHYLKDLKTRVFNFTMENANNTTTFTNFSFDEATGKVKGKLTVTGTDNSTDKNATVEANLDVKLNKMVF